MPDIPIFLRTFPRGIVSRPDKVTSAGWVATRGRVWTSLYVSLIMRHILDHPLPTVAHFVLKRFELTSPNESAMAIDGWRGIRGYLSPMADVAPHALSHNKSKLLVRGLRFRAAGVFDPVSHKRACRLLKRAGVSEI